jgi:hypothetical protein
LVNNCYGYSKWAEQKHYRFSFFTGITMKKLKLLPLGLAAFFLGCLLMLPRPVAADFQANRLIDDIIFNTSGALDANAINAFLNTFASSCISPNSGFEARVPSGYSASSGFSFGDFTSAGQVIATAAQVYGINPEVLIVTLEKEQSLVSGRSNFSGYCNNGDEHKYAAAMGYGCPDSGDRHSWTGVSLYRRSGIERTDTGTTCVSTADKAGFSQQTIRAAWLLKFGQQRSLGNTSWAIIGGSWDNSDDPATCYGGPMTQGSFKRCSSDTPTYYDGYTVIDGVSTHMDTGATAALYWYTPHFHGNQNFVSLFNQYFGIQYANDTYSPHPNGTLVALAGRVYLIENGTKRWIASGDVFTSYGYPWFQVKTGTTGDTNLSTGTDINTLAPGTIFYTDNSPVYVMTYVSGSLVKQQISAAAFNALGYNWSDVMYVSPANVPATTAPTILVDNQHPAGTLVAGNGRVYLLAYNSSSSQFTKKWVVNPDAFVTNNFDWNRVKTATAQDLSLADDSTSVDLRQGNVLFHNGNIYLVDYDSDGILKRPLGPWECFASRWHYSYRDLYQTVALPARTGSIATC